MVFITKLGPQVSLSPIPFFCVNTHYTQPQKLLYALVITSRKLHHYFQAHKIVVPSSFPLGEIICNRDANGRIVK
jgi:hypothetical protein